MFLANTHRQQHQLHLRHPPQQHQRPLIIPLCKLPLRPAALLYHTRLKAQTLEEEEEEQEQEQEQEEDQEEGL